jgi:hypothetical protein
MNEYWMNRISAGAVRLGLAVGLGMAALPALASSAGSLQVTVTPIDRNATYTQSANATTGALARPSVLGYTVSIRNIGRSTVTQIRFAGTTSVTDAQERATLNSIVGVSGCVVSAGGTSIDCPIGRLKSGESFPTFQVVFNTPVQDTASPLNAGTDFVNFSGRVFVAGNKAAEGRSTGGNPNSPPSNFSQAWTATPILLGTATNTNVRSLILANGGGLFTGKNGVPVLSESTNNPFTSLITVPPIGNTRPAWIELTEENTPLPATFATLTTSGPPPCSENVTRCFRADVTLPGTFSPFLTIVLRQDKETIRKVYRPEWGHYPKRVAIGEIDILYSSEATPANPTFYTNEKLRLCRIDPVTHKPIPNGPEAHGANPAGLPCIAARRVVKASDHPAPPADLVGDYEWTIYNVVNGGYRVR